jgi:type VI secretion system secreted protein Hcp
MATDAFLELDGVEGESTRTGFEGQIELTSFSMGGHNPAASGKVNLTPFTFTKESDKSTPGIFNALVTGKRFPKAKVTLHKAGGDEAVDFLVYEFEKVFIQDMSCSGGLDADPVENVSMSYGKVTLTYTPMTGTGAKGSPMVMSWDQSLAST